MKVLLQYDPQDDEDESVATTLKLTLPAKWLDGPTDKIRECFVDQFNKKHPDSKVDSADSRLELEDGSVLGGEAIVSSCIMDNAKLILKRGKKQPSPLVSSSSSANTATTVSTQPHAQNSVPCKRFGCGKRFVPGETTTEVCRFHKKPPVFHETRKYWACCPEKVAWDWESFTAIPGCTTEPTHSDVDPKQKIMGGTELRAEKLGELGPQQILVEKSGLEKLSNLRSALIALGVEGGVFDRARDAAKASLMLSEEEEEDGPKVWDRVCVLLGTKFATVLKQIQ